MAGSGRHSAGRRRSLVHKAPKKLDSVRNEINVTPLVDVCLVLLIIFMVILPMLTRGKEVQLPETDNHEVKQSTAGEGNNLPPVVAVDKEGKVWVEKIKTGDLSEMETRLREFWAATNTEGDVAFKADINVHWDKVYPVIMELNRLGLNSIKLAVNESDKAKKAAGEAN